MSPEGVDPKEVWTYIHGIDKKTGKVLWRESAGTVVHNTPVVGRTADGTLAVSHAAEARTLRWKNRAATASRASPRDPRARLSGTPNSVDTTPPSLATGTKNTSSAF